MSNPPEGTGLGFPPHTIDGICPFKHMHFLGNTTLPQEIWARVGEPCEECQTHHIVSSSTQIKMIMEQLERGRSQLRCVCVCVCVWVGVTALTAFANKWQCTLLQLVHIFCPRPAMRFQPGCLGGSRDRCVPLTHRRGRNQ